MDVDKLVQQLNESVKRRQGVFRDKPIELSSPDFPIKGITPEMMKDYEKTHADVTSKVSSLPPHERVRSRHYQRIYRHPFYRKVVDYETAKIYRGTIRGSTPVRYSFKPDRMKGRKFIGARYSEQGAHIYDFTTPLNKKGSVYITHSEAAPSLQRKGIRTSSYIGFDVEGTTEKSEEPNIKHGVSVFRTVLPAIRHHIRSHNPDRIVFKSLVEPYERQARTPLQGGESSVFGKRTGRNTRKNLYTFLVKKLSKTHDVKITTGDDDGAEHTTYTLTRKRKNANSLQTAIKLLNAERTRVQKKLRSKKQIKENNERFSDLDQDEWDAEFDRQMDSGGFSAQEIINKMGKRPLAPRHFWELPTKEKFAWIRQNIIKRNNPPRKP